MKSVWTTRVIAGQARRIALRRSAGWVGGALLGLAGCAAESAQAPMTPEQLQDPETCKGCHATHYNQWRGSMHAYASKDPVFLAMNQRGQREAGLGDFCVKCHAPMAVRSGATRDGLNLASLPDHLQGVTCYFCHNAVGLGEPHNNSLILANDSTMRAALTRPPPLEPSAHDVGFSKFHDRSRVESSALCGACHDIVTPAPMSVHLERTFEEYSASIYPTALGAGNFQSCQSCHMEDFDGPAAPGYPGVGSRRIHEHLWPAVDLALTPFPNQDAMRAAIELCALPNSIKFSDKSFQAHNDDPGRFTVVLETQAGHAQPSGSSQDRRMWVELTSFDAAGRQLSASGVLADNEEDFSTPDAFGNPVWELHDRIFNAAGEEVHMFWEAAPSTMHMTGFESTALPVAQPSAPDHSRRQDYILGPPHPARLEIRVRMRPMSLVVLQDLVRTGDLAPQIVAAMPTFTVASARVTWDGPRDDQFDVTPTSANDCNRYKCMLGEPCVNFEPGP